MKKMLEKKCEMMGVGWFYGSYSNLMLAHDYYVKGRQRMKKRWLEATERR